MNDFSVSSMCPMASETVEIPTDHVSPHPVATETIPTNITKRWYQYYSPLTTRLRLCNSLGIYGTQISGVRLDTCLSDSFPAWLDTVSGKTLNVSTWGQRSASFWNRAALPFHVCGKGGCHPGSRPAGIHGLTTSWGSPPCKYYILLVNEYIMGS